MAKYSFGITLDGRYAVRSVDLDVLVGAACYDAALSDIPRHDLCPGYGECGKTSYYPGLRLPELLMQLGPKWTKADGTPCYALPVERFVGLYCAGLPDGTPHDLWPLTFEWLWPPERSEARFAALQFGIVSAVDTALCRLRRTTVADYPRREVLAAQLTELGF